MVALLSRRGTSKASEKRLKSAKKLHHRCGIVILGLLVVYTGVIWFDVWYGAVEKYPAIKNVVMIMYLILWLAIFLTVFFRHRCAWMVEEEAEKFEGREEGERPSKCSFNEICIEMTCPSPQLIN